MDKTAVDPFDVADNLLQEVATDPELNNMQYTALAGSIHFLMVHHGVVFTPAMQQSIVQDKAPATIASLPHYVTLRGLLRAA
jgi:hypothetical protein